MSRASTGHPESPNTGREAGRYGWRRASEPFLGQVQQRVRFPRYCGGSINWARSFAGGGKPSKVGRFAPRLPRKLTQTPPQGGLILYARPFSCHPRLAFALNPFPRASEAKPPYTSTPNPDFVQISMRLPSVSDMKNTRCPSLRVPISALSILTPFPLSSSYAASISATSNAP